MHVYCHICSVPLLTFSRVRSFENGHGETIQFHTPLTLIVGYNGSGKTVRTSLVKVISLLIRTPDYHRMSQVCHNWGSSPEQQRRGFHTRPGCTFIWFCARDTHSQICSYAEKRRFSHRSRCRSTALQERRWWLPGT